MFPFTMSAVPPPPSPTDFAGLMVRLLEEMREQRKALTDEHDRAAKERSSEMRWKLFFQGVFFIAPVVLGLLYFTWFLASSGVRIGPWPRGEELRGGGRDSVSAALRGNRKEFSPRARQGVNHARFIDQELREFARELRQRSERGETLATAACIGVLTGLTSNVLLEVVLAGSARPEFPTALYIETNFRYSVSDRTGALTWGSGSPVEGRLVVIESHRNITSGERHAENQKTA
jgi:hypothetical protein